MIKNYFSLFFLIICFNIINLKRILACEIALINLIIFFKKTFASKIEMFNEFIF